MIYHKEIGFPRAYIKPVGKKPTLLSRHAKDRSAEKGFVIPETVDMNDFDVIEIEWFAGAIAKLVIRGEYDNYDDIVMAVVPKGNAFFVKTAWLNAWDDTHKTLDVSKYGRP